jgi:hypothetical protein
LKNPIACDPKNRPYKNGKTFEDCKAEARKNTSALSGEIQSYSQISWNRIREAADYDEIVYKLTLKYLKDLRYDIGNYLTPRVTAKSSDSISSNNAHLGDPHPQ